MGLVKTVFHVHTDYSHDSNNSVDGLLAEARAKGIGCLTITDHDNIDGARAAAARSRDVQIIIGEEVATSHGDMIGLFLHEFIEPGQSPRKTAELIHRQGGIVVVPHPFNRMFDCSLREAIYDVIDQVDVIEVCNAQNLSSIPNRQARSLAERFGIPMLVGGDVHHPGYLDSCYQLLPAFKGPGEFLKAVRQAQLVESRHPLSYFVKSARFVFYEKTGLCYPEGYGRNHPSRTQPVPAASEAA